MLFPITNAKQNSNHGKIFVQNALSNIPTYQQTHTFNSGNLYHEPGP